MQLGLKDKRAQVLAAGGGLGRAIVRSLAAEGSKLVVADVDVAAVEKTVTELGADTLGEVPVKWKIAQEFPSITCLSGSSGTER